MCEQGILFEPSALNTHDQNGQAERLEGIIIAKARLIRIKAKFLYNLWQETVNTAVYLYNRTLRYANDWQTLYKRFYIYLGQQEGTGNTAKKPQLAHLKAYGCRAYAMTKDAQLKRKRLLKLDPRTYIGYLVGYNSTNIYKIWVPH
jgi:hypothetical protein